MNRLLLLMGIVIACVLATSVFAADAATTVPVSGPPSAQAMLANIAEELPSIMRLVTAIAYVLGIYFIFYAVLKLKQYGEMRSQMSHERHLQGSIVLFVAGALLLYLPTSVEIGLSTFWTNPSPYGYMTQTNPWGDFIKDVFLVMQM